jgi:hypothetical protein
MCPRPHGAHHASRPRTAPSPPGPEEDLRRFEALLCTFIARAGGSVRLPVQDVADCGNGLQLYVRATPHRDAVELAVGPRAAPERRTAKTRRPAP